MAEFTDNVIKGPPSWFKSESKSLGSERAPGGPRALGERQEASNGQKSRKQKVHLRLVSEPQTQAHTAYREDVQQTNTIKGELSALREDKPKKLEIVLDKDNTVLIDAGDLNKRENSATKQFFNWEKIKRNLGWVYRRQRLARHLIEAAERHPEIKTWGEKRRGTFATFLEVLFNFFAAFIPKRKEKTA